MLRDGGGSQTRNQQRQGCCNLPPQSGSAISLLRSEPAHPRKRESTRERESSTTESVAVSRNTIRAGEPTYGVMTDRISMTE